MLFLFVILRISFLFSIFFFLSFPFILLFRVLSKPDGPLLRGAQRSAPRFNRGQAKGDLPAPCIASSQWSFQFQNLPLSTKEKAMDHEWPYLSVHPSKQFENTNLTKSLYSFSFHQITTRDMCKICVASVQHSKSTKFLLFPTRSYPSNVSTIFLKEKKFRI